MHVQALATTRLGHAAHAQLRCQSRRGSKALRHRSRCERTRVAGGSDRLPPPLLCGRCIVRRAQLAVVGVFEVKDAGRGLRRRRSVGPGCRRRRGLALQREVDVVALRRVRVELHTATHQLPVRRKVQRFLHTAAESALRACAPCVRVCERRRAAPQHRHREAICHTAGATAHTGRGALSGSCSGRRVTQQQPA
jgi:hypothetical protein